MGVLEQIERRRGGGIKGTVLDFCDFAGNVIYYLAALFLKC